MSDGEREATHLAKEEADFQAGFFDAVGAFDVEQMKAYIASKRIDQGSLPVALWSAAAMGHVGMVKLFIPHTEPHENESQALHDAAEHGHVEVVKVLIPVSRPKDKDSQALWMAAARGHATVVRLLLPVTDPMACASAALRAAADMRHTAVVKLLLPVSDVERAGIELAVDARWDSLDWLALTMHKMDHADLQVVRWVEAHGERLPTMAHQRLTQAREGQAGTLEGVAHRSRARARC